MDKNYKYVLLTIVAVCLVVLTIVEVTGISRNAMFRKFHTGGEGVFYSRSGEVYRGEIFPEQTRSRSQIVAEMNKTTVQFYETKYNFGTISPGRVVNHTFRFKNTGQNPLMIAKTDVTCGCTTPNFPLESIAPGSDGEITVSYNSENQMGHQEKNVVIHSNALPESIAITVEADIR